MRPTLRQVTTAGATLPLLPVRFLGLAGAYALNRVTRGSLANASRGLSERALALRSVEVQLESVGPRTIDVSAAS